MLETLHMKYQQLYNWGWAMPLAEKKKTQKKTIALTQKQVENNFSTLKKYLLQSDFIPDMFISLFFFFLFQIECKVSSD